MTLLQFINDVLLPGTIHVFAMADQVIQLFKDLKIFDISFLSLALTIGFITFFINRTVDSID